MIARDGHAETGLAEAYLLCKSRLGDGAGECRPHAESPVRMAVPSYPSGSSNGSVPNISKYFEIKGTTYESLRVGLSYASKIIAKLVLVAEILTLECHTENGHSHELTGKITPVTQRIFGTLFSLNFTLLSAAMAGKTGLKAKWRHLADLPHSGARHPHHGTPLPCQGALAAPSCPCPMPMPAVCTHNIDGTEQPEMASRNT